jgi:hypothetical protein
MNSKMVRKLHFLIQMWKKKFMAFHKANKLSSNISWVDSKTLNVIPYFQDRASRGRAACYSSSSNSHVPPQHDEICCFQKLNCQQK